MGATVDSLPPLSPPKPAYFSKYKNAQTQTPRSDRISYRRSNHLRTVEKSPSERRFSLSLRTGSQSWRFSKPPIRVNRRTSIPSQSRPVPETPDYQVSSIRDWEAQLAVFRMSWHDEPKLFDPKSIYHSEKSDEATDLDIVDWDGPKDPENPLNWSEGRKWANIVILSIITMISTLASSMFPPGVAQIMAEFKFENLPLSSFVGSVYILGYAFGPMLMAPCTELYGRLYVYHVSHVLFIIFIVGCAFAQSLSTLIILRFLAGVAGSTPMTIGSSSVADMFVPQERYRAMSIWSLGALIGPVIGPTLGGLLAAAKGWRSISWTLTIAMASSTLVSFFVLRESYAPTLLARKAARLRQSTLNPLLQSKYEVVMTIPRTAVLTRAIIRPMKMLFFSPIVFAFSTYMALVYGYLYLLFTSLSDTFAKIYNFQTSMVGVAYLGIGIGMVGGTAAYSLLANRLTSNAASKVMDSEKPSEKPQRQPEHCLPPMIPGAACIPAGLLIYGWTAEEEVFSLVPILGTVLFGMGLVFTFMPVVMYLVEAYTIYAASAIAANTIMRSLGGGLIPLAGRPLYEMLGQGGGNTLLAGLALVGVPVAWAIYRHGESIRLRWPVTFEEKVMDDES